MQICIVAKLVIKVLRCLGNQCYKDKINLVTPLIETGTRDVFIQQRSYDNLYEAQLICLMTVN